MSGILFFGIFVLLRGLIPLGNMSYYVAACFIFAAATVTTYILLQAGKLPFLASPKVESGMFVTSIIIFMMWMIGFFISEPEVTAPDLPAPLRQVLPFYVWLLIILVALVIVTFLFRLFQNIKSGKISFTIRCIVSIIFTAIASSMLYSPNLFRDIQGGTYHSTAYTNSIIMACWKTPFSEAMHDYYGHYAILYIPFIKVLRKLFGINFWIGTCIMITIFTAITILGFAYALNFFAKNEVIFYLSLFCIGNQLFMKQRGSGVYYQLFPHRFLFPTLLLAFCIWEKKHKIIDSVKSNIIATILLTLSVVWSTEIGIVCLLSFFAYRLFCKLYDKEPFDVKKLIPCVKYLFTCIVIPFALAYLFVGIYNAWAGASLFMSFKEYMYPLISDRNYLAEMEFELPGITSLWVMITVLFMTFICMIFIPVLVGSKEIKDDYALYFLMAVLSEGSLFYYINRPVYGCIVIVIFFAVILLAVIIEKTQHYSIHIKDIAIAIKQPGGASKVFHVFYRYIAMFILITMFIDSVYYLPESIRTAKETIWNMEDYDEFTHYIYEQVPPQAYYIGEGVPELAAYLDRDPSLHCTEWSINNMTPAELCAVGQKIEQELPQWIFINLASMAELQTHCGPVINDHYSMHEVMEYNGVEFAMFDRIEQ